MAVTDFIAPPRTHSGHAHPSSGVTHVRTRLTSDFTILHNALAQRRGSAVTVGVGAYIMSLPDGAPVSIDALCAHFDEGPITLSRALRELEHAGYLVRRKERWVRGLIRTRTFFRTVPGLRLPEPETPPGKTPAQPAPGAPEATVPAPRLPAEAQTAPDADADPDPDPDPDQAPDPGLACDAASDQREADQQEPDPQEPDSQEPEGETSTADGTESDTGTSAPPDSATDGDVEEESVDEEGIVVEEESVDEEGIVEEEGAEDEEVQEEAVENDAPLGITGVDPRAVVILASLRIVDTRLILSRREVAELAPAVADWLAHGMDAATITETLTAALPAPLRARPARILAYRLRDQPVSLPPSPRTAGSDPTGLPGTQGDETSPRPPLPPWQTCDGGCERAFRAPEPGSCRDCTQPEGPPPGCAADTGAATGSIASMRTALRESKEARAVVPAKRRKFSVRSQPWARAAAPA